MESRTQWLEAKDTKKNPRPRTALSRTDPLEAKNTNSSALQKKRSLQKFFRRSPEKNVFQKMFRAFHKILTIQKIVLSSSLGQANFRGLEASRATKCVLEHSTSSSENCFEFLFTKFVACLKATSRDNYRKVSYQRTELGRRRNDVDRQPRFIYPKDGGRFDAPKIHVFTF